MRYKSVFILLLTLFLSNELFAQKVKDSNKRKPDWVDEQPANFIVVCSMGSDLEEAKTASINNVRERIASSISSSVKSTFTQTTKEEINGTDRFWNEGSESKILIETQLAGALSGVSESFANDIYWEKIVNKKDVSFNYCILYPFSRTDLDGFMAQFEINRMKIKRKREELMTEYDNCKTFLELTNLAARVKQEGAAADALYASVFKSMNSMLSSEIEKLTPRVEREYDTSILVAFYTGSGKRVSVNPTYNALSKVIPYNTTTSNCDSLLFNIDELRGRRNVAVTVNYQFKNSSKTETIYWTPKDLSTKIQIEEISESRFVSEGVIDILFDLSGDEFSELISVNINAASEYSKLLPAEGNNKLKKGSNKLALVLGNPNEARKFVPGQLYDVQLFLLNRNGETTEKTFYNVLMK